MSPWKTTRSIGVEETKQLVKTTREESHRCSITQKLMSFILLKNCNRIENTYETLFLGHLYMIHIMINQQSIAEHGTGPQWYNI